MPQATPMVMAAVSAGTTPHTEPCQTNPHLAAEPAAAAVNEVFSQLNPLCFLIALHVGALGAARAQEQAPGTILASIVVLLAEDAGTLQLIPRLAALSLSWIRCCCCCCYTWCHAAACCFKASFVVAATEQIKCGRLAPAHAAGGSLLLFCGLTVVNHSNLADCAADCNAR